MTTIFFYLPIFVISAQICPRYVKKNISSIMLPINHFNLSVIHDFLGVIYVGYSVPQSITSYQYTSSTLEKHHHVSLTLFQEAPTVFPRMKSLQPTESFTISHCHLSTCSESTMMGRRRRSPCVGLVCMRVFEEEENEVIMESEWR